MRAGTNEEIEAYHFFTNVFGDYYGSEVRKRDHRKQPTQIHTPPAVVKFMNDSVKAICKKEFGGDSVNVNVLDPFNGANAIFLVDRIRREPDQSRKEEILEHFSGNELEPVNYWGSLLEIAEAVNGTLEKLIANKKIMSKITCGDTFQQYEEAFNLSNDRCWRARALTEQFPIVVREVYDEFSQVRSEYFMNGLKERVIIKMIKPIVMKLIDEYRE